MTAPSEGRLRLMQEEIVPTLGVRQSLVYALIRRGLRIDLVLTGSAVFGWTQNRFS